MGLKILGLYRKVFGLFYMNSGLGVKETLKLIEGFNAKI